MPLVSRGRGGENSSPEKVKGVPPTSKTEMTNSRKKIQVGDPTTLRLTGPELIRRAKRIKVLGTERWGKSTEKVAAM